jgi:hypothetical protein
MFTSQTCRSLALLICLHLWFLSVRARAEEMEWEIVANLAAGRVEIYPARDAIVIGTVEKHIEPDSHPPMIVTISSRHLGILLGAAEWVMPGSGRPPVRLNQPLSVSSGPPRPQLQPGSDQAGDIEAIGLAFLERLRPLAGELHRKVSLQPDEPLVELLLIGNDEGYGPEVWLLKYRIEQNILRGEYWQTRVLRPSYTQLYPPEKGQPRTLIEVRYPPDDASPGLLDLVKQNDPRLARLRSSDIPIARALEHLQSGDSQKALPDDAAAFLRAALPAVFGTESQLALGVLSQQHGLEWLLEPAEPPQRTEESKPREPGAPTLRKKPP